MTSYIGAQVLHRRENLWPCKVQYPDTNSPHWSPYIFFQNPLKEFDKRSKHFPFGDHFKYSHHLFLDYVLILLGGNGCWSLLGRRGCPMYSLEFWIPRCGFQIPGTGFQSLSVELGFRIPIVNVSRITRVVFRIPKPRIPDSNRKISLDYGFHMPQFCTFWYPNSLRPVSNVVLLPC